MVIHQCCIACRADYARRRIELTAARLTVLAAAHALDKYGNKKARNQIAAAKVYAPNVVLKVLDQAVQVSTFCTSASIHDLFLDGRYCESLILVQLSSIVCWHVRFYAVPCSQ